jgi:hypothetical protein
MENLAFIASLLISADPSCNGTTNDASGLQNTIQILSDQKAKTGAVSQDEMLSFYLKDLQNRKGIKVREESPDEGEDRPSEEALQKLTEINSKLVEELKARFKANPPNPSKEKFFSDSLDYFIKTPFSGGAYDYHVYDSVQARRAFIEMEAEALFGKDRIHVITGLEKKFAQSSKENYQKDQIVAATSDWMKAAFLKPLSIIDSPYYEFFQGYQAPDVIALWESLDDQSEPLLERLSYDVAQISIEGSGKLFVKEIANHRRTQDPQKWDL